MPRKAFSQFHGAKNDKDTDSYSNADKGQQPDFDDSEDLQDLTAFNEKSANEALFRLKILKFITQECSEINLKNIEPLRVKLQLAESRQIPSSITIYRWWLSYRKSGFNVTSLAPKIKQRGNRATKVPEVVSGFMDKAIEQVISVEQINVNNAFRRVRRKVRQYNLTHNTLHKYPSYEAIRKRVKKLTPYEKLAAKKGERVAKREFRRMGKKILTESILERVEIDHTWLDLFAVHEKYRVPIGRPYLTQLVDCYSKAVIGFYLGFEPPSYMSVALALKNAIKRKDQLLSQYPSVQKDWVCYGIPDLLVTDNGKEFLSADFIRACDSLFINVHQNKVDTPDNKPHTERQYGTTNTSLLNDLPGKAFSNYLQREGYNAIDEASLTLNEIKEIYLNWLVDIFHPKSNSRGTNCPNVTWKQAARVWPPNEFAGTDEELDFCFAKLETRSLRKEGIRLDTELYYSSDRLAEYRGRKGDHKATIKYNPNNMGFIWVLDEDNESYFKVPAIDYEYASEVTLWLHKKNIELKKELSNSEYDQDAEIDAELRIEKIVDASISKKKTSITNRRRAARYEEHSERAKEAKVPPPTDRVNSDSTNNFDIDDSSNWDIDYV
ncbi:integrase [Photobacterium proteolyticum]|uniref:Integrase n=1 Tax=Photobacterium proteolyticum TaxID=1903952 RepID=A0A1Q9H279_9GAMM|nr:Mu transposase C-terminal domain-containing protein [Photobacterium proteolyticum]OLQ81705.1 integrase [Photobacterium proteolyticum]